ncbi:FAD-dependent oxidoreductase [Nocardia vaccinii]|uniref:FAD-dependent oxidoreductase n=1 Tax=Nocardia vaccinii TaxID=1822 RepID=UPI00082B4486|nr:FAD-dependent monooxygenase [Nocardia vaccinii]
MNTVPATASVVVIGAGPTGMTAGIALADAGVDVVLLDRLAEGANTSRAAVVHARTLEVLDEFGVAAELNERGLVVEQFDLNDGPQRLATIHFKDLPTRFPYTLMISQATTEEVLLTRLRKAGGTVLRPYTVTAVEGDETGVSVEFTDAAGGSGSIRADYVIGADGMHSVVREQAGIGFTGASYPESFALADVRMDWPDPRTEVSLHLAPQGFTLVAPLPDEQRDRFRIVATVDDAPEHPDLAFMQAVIDERRPGGRVREVLWSSRFRVHHRLADHYRAGRILLAGDAAHVHSPAGGQGMNTGIQDGALLGRLLAQVLHGEPDALLDEYEAIRRPVAQGVVELTDRMTRMATLQQRPARALRNTVIRSAVLFPGVRRAVAFRLSELTAR